MIPISSLLLYNNIWEEVYETYLTLDVGGSAIKYALLQEDLTILEKIKCTNSYGHPLNFIETIGKNLINFKIRSMVWLFLCLVSLILKEAINMKVVLLRYIDKLETVEVFKEALSNKHYNWYMTLNVPPMRKLVLEISKIFKMALWLF